MSSRSSIGSVLPSWFMPLQPLLIRGIIVAALLSNRFAIADGLVEQQQANMERAKQFVRHLRERHFDDASTFLAESLQLSVGHRGLERVLRQAEATCGRFKDCKQLEWEIIADTDLLVGRTRWQEAQGLYLRFDFDQAGAIAGLWLEGDAAHAPPGFPESGMTLGSLKNLVATARHSIIAHVELPDGTKVPKSSIALWKLAEATEASAKSRGRVWTDVRNSRSWRGLDGAATGSSMSFSRLLPGTYCVTAQEGHHSSGRIGISDPIEVASTTEKSEITIRLQPGATLEVNPIDVVTQSVMQCPQMILRRLGQSSPYDQFWPIQDRSNPVRFEGLPAGEYLIEAILRAGDPDGLQFEMQNPEQTVTIESTTETVDLPMKARLLTDEEINQRYGWTAFGIVTDETGKPMPDVEVRVATGVGTLLGGGRTRTNRDGHYRLRFGEGIMSFDATGVCAQSAIFWVKHPSHDVKSSTRPLRTTMARKLPDEDQSGGRNPDEIPLRGQPYRLDFVLCLSKTTESKRYRFDRSEYLARSRCESYSARNQNLDGNSKTVVDVCAISRFSQSKSHCETGKSAFRKLNFPVSLAAVFWTGGGKIVAPMLTHGNSAR